MRRDVVSDAQRKLRDRLGVIGSGLRHTGSNHVCIAHRLNLLEPELGHEPVEHSKELIQDPEEGESRSFGLFLDGNL